jgi:hypothetical protein
MNECISPNFMNNLGMKKRPRRFSLPEAFFEGSRAGGREDCLSTPNAMKDAKQGQAQVKTQGKYCICEFRTAEKNAEGTALKT